MVLELVLSSVALKKAIKLNIAAPEITPIIFGLEWADRYRHDDYFLKSCRMAFVGRRGFSMRVSTASPLSVVTTS